MTLGKICLFFNVTTSKPLRYLPFATFLFFLSSWRHDTCGSSLRAVVTHHERQPGTNSLSVPTAHFLVHAMPFETLLWLLAARLIVPLAAVLQSTIVRLQRFSGPTHSHKCIRVTAADTWVPQTMRLCYAMTSRLGPQNPWNWNLFQVTVTV